MKSRFLLQGNGFFHVNTKIKSIILATNKTKKIQSSISCFVKNDKHTQNYILHLIKNKN